MSKRTALLICTALALIAGCAFLALQWSSSPDSKTQGETSPDHSSHSVHAGKNSATGTNDRIQKRKGSTRDDSPDENVQVRRNANAHTVEKERLARYVGSDTVDALAEGGPYEAKDVRTIAHSLNEVERQLAEMRQRDAPTERIREVSKQYYELQNHYYAVLNELEPYDVDEEAADRLSEYDQALESRGGDLTDEERSRLKREVLLGETKGASEATR
jgi:hypothetical protein